jgi:hypothetical protein
LPGHLEHGVVVGVLANGVVEVVGKWILVTTAIYVEIAVVLFAGCLDGVHGRPREAAGVDRIDGNLLLATRAVV